MLKILCLNSILLTECFFKLFFAYFAFFLLKYDILDKTQAFNIKERYSEKQSELTITLRTVVYRMPYIARNFENYLYVTCGIDLDFDILKLLFFFLLVLKQYDISKDAY